MKREGLDEQVRRTKARWLRRVMYDVRPNSTEKCLAYLVADRLNCVTCDCWPAQSTMATWLGVESVRTVQRAARSLQRLGYFRPMIWTIPPTRMAKRVQLMPTRLSWNPLQESA